MVGMLVVLYQVGEAEPVVALIVEVARVVEPVLRVTPEMMDGVVVAGTDVL